MSLRKKFPGLREKRFNYYRHLHRHLCRDCYAGGDAWLYPHFNSADGGVVPLIGGIPYMLYVTKAKKFDDCNHGFP